MQQTLVIQAPIFSQSGYGAHSRDIIMSLWKSQKYNIVTFPVNWGGTSTTYNLTPQEIEVLSYTTSNKLHDKSIEFIWIQIGIPTEFQRQGKYNIGITAGNETTKLAPKWKEGCNRMDCIIVPSVFEQQLLINEGVTVPVYIVGEGVDVDIFNEKELEDDKNDIDLLLNGIETDFNFLGGGQWLGANIGEDRKGIGKLIQVFLDEFEKDKNVGLILKTFSVNNSSVDRYYTEERIKEIKQDREYPRIYLLSGELKNNELQTLYHHKKVKGFASLTSGEGWHRMLIESMSSDLPVIATAWSGHMDYMSKNNFDLINYNLGPIPVNTVRYNPEFFTQDMQWAHVDVKDAKKKMRKLYEGEKFAKERAIKEGQRIRKDWNKEVCYQKLLDILDNIQFETRKSSILLPTELL